MPPLPRPPYWTGDRRKLTALGVERAERFCSLNRIPMPAVNVVDRDDWRVGFCAYYRPDTEAVRKWTAAGISICPELCGYPCGEAVTRNWTWPGNDTDREPYGVIAHELGHHCDWLAGSKKGTYFSDYGEGVMEESGEKPLTGYAAENPAEWFAEAFRLFVTNPGLLKALRPKTYNILRRKWEPLNSDDWRFPLGSNVPARVVKNLIKKGAE